MSHQLSECPNCRRAFLGGASRSGRAEARCRVCGTPLVQAGGEEEAEAPQALQGRPNSLSSMTRISLGEERPR